MNITLAFNLEGTGQLLNCTVTLRTQPIMRLITIMMMMMKGFMLFIFIFSLPQTHGGNCL